MTTLITGATGFVGSAVARRLLAEGLELRALVRRGADRRNLDGLALEVADGDLLDPASLAAAVRGCRAVFHIAADYRLWVPDPAAMHRANVDATVTLMRAALDAGVERVVHTSSVAVLGLVPGGAADETTPSTLADMVGPYKRSKFLAEEAVRRMIAADGLPAVIVNPAAPIGPRDAKPTPTGRLVVDAAAGRMPAFVDTGLNVVHVDDVAEGHWLAFRHGAVGERYVLGAENLTLEAILGIIAGLTGRSPPRVRLPHGLVLPIAHVAEAVARLTGREPFATVDGIRMARKRMFFSSDKAVNRLGYRPRPAREALADAIAWFQANGYL